MEGGRGGELNLGNRSSFLTFTEASRDVTVIPTIFVTYGQLMGTAKMCLPSIPNTRTEIFQAGRRVADKTQTAHFERVKLSTSDFRFQVHEYFTFFFFFCHETKRGTGEK